MLGVSVDERPVPIPPVVDVMHLLAVNVSVDGLIEQLTHAASKLQPKATTRVGAYARSLS
jgi:hypothetical protein